MPAAQLYARHARIFDEDGEEFFHAGDVSWSETNVVQATARRPEARAYYLVDAAALDERVRERTVRELVEAAPPDGRVPLDRLPFGPPPGTVAAVRVVAAITHTIGGVRIDGSARVLNGAGAPLAGLWAAGVDAGGVATGGYASGLAQAPSSASSPPSRPSRSRAPPDRRRVLASGVRPTLMGWERRHAAASTLPDEPQSSVTALCQLCNNLVSSGTKASLALAQTGAPGEHRKPTMKISATVPDTAYESRTSWAGPLAL